MPDRDGFDRAPEGSSFAPVPVAPGGGRRPVAIAILVVAIMSGSFALARLSPQEEPGQAIESSAPVAEASPRVTERPTPAVPQPTATALPPREWYTAPEAPIVDVLLARDEAVRWLRLGNAIRPDDPLARPGRDLLLAGSQNETFCLCWESTSVGGLPASALTLVRRDDDPDRTALWPVTTVVGLSAERDPYGQVQVALESSADGTLAYLVRAARTADRWQVDLDVIDLATASIVDTSRLISIVETQPSIIQANEAPTVRVSPDGGRLLVMTGTQRLASLGTATASRHAWLVEMDGPTIGRAVAADAVADAGESGPVETCAWVDFATPAVIAKGCRYPDPDAPTADRFEIRRYDASGRPLGALLTEEFRVAPESILLDATAGVAYAWDPDGHALVAVDLVAGGWRSAGAPPDDRVAPNDVEVTQPRPDRGEPVVWSDGRAATATTAERALVGSPDGRLVFVAGLGPTGEGSSGIWVVDTATMSLVERWPALATYDSLALFENGRFLAALGRPGVTGSGGPADWTASVTVHDTTTGQAVVRVGDLGAPTEVGFPWIGRAATP